MAVLLGRTTGTNSADWTANGNLAAHKFTATTSGTLTKLFMTPGIANAGVTSVWLAIYSDAGGADAANLLGSVQVTTGVTGTGTISGTLSSGVPIVAGTNYWLAWEGIGEQFDFNAQTAGAYREKTVAGPPPNPWGTAGINGTFTPLIWGESDAPAPVSLGKTASAAVASSYAHTMTGTAPAGSRVFLAVAWASDTLRTISSVSNPSTPLAWTRLGGVTGTDAGGFYGIDIWSAVTTGVMSAQAITANFSGSNSWGTNIHCWYQSGLASTSVVDGTPTGILRGTPTTSWSTGALTTTAANDTLYALAFADGPAGSGGATSVPGSGWTELDTDLLSASNDWGSTLVYQPVAAAGSYTATGTWSTAPSFTDQTLILAVRSTPAPLSTLPADNFNSGVIDRALWVDNRGPVGIEHGEAIIPSRAGAGCSFSTTNNLNLTGTAMVGRFPDFPQTSGVSSWFIAAINPITSGNDYNSFLAFVKEDTWITLRKSAGFTYDDTWIDPYDPVQHMWWRIRESGGTVYWDTAPDAAGDPDPAPACGPTTAAWRTRLP